jgi:methoxymalonate biosynthesis acyl carrier protein
VTAGIVEDQLVDFLAARTKAQVSVDENLFGAGLVSSMFVMELVVHLERTYSVAIVGKDLKMDNFRTVRTMSVLVSRLRNGVSASGG